MNLNLSLDELRRRGATISKTPAEIMAENKAQTAADGSFVIRLPLPTAACNPNSRFHWSVKAKAVKSMRETAWAAVASPRFVYEKSFERPVIDATFWFKYKRRRDRDNAIASLKGAIDGLVDAGLFKDDDSVRWGDIALMTDKDDPRVVLTVREGAM